MINKLKIYFNITKIKMNTIISSDHVDVDKSEAKLVISDYFETTKTNNISNIDIDEIFKKLRFYYGKYFRGTLNDEDKLLNQLFELVKYFKMCRIDDDIEFEIDNNRLSLMFRLKYKHKFIKNEYYRPFLYNSLYKLYDSSYGDNRLGDYYIDNARISRDKYDELKKIRPKKKFIMNSFSTCQFCVDKGRAEIFLYVDSDFHLCDTEAKSENYDGEYKNPTNKELDRVIDDFKKIYETTLLYTMPDKFGIYDIINLEMFRLKSKDIGGIKNIVDEKTFNNKIFNNKNFYDVYIC